MTLPRVYPILDTATLASRGVDLATAAEALLSGGACILQLRHKEHWSKEIFEQAQFVSILCTAAKVPLIVNDRADIAKMLGVAGVHVGQDDLAPRDVRRVIGPAAVVGFSTHNRLQLSLAQIEPVTYFALGPIFATGSKENPDPVLGLIEISGCRGLCNKPLVAIGGITLENAPQVFAAGADSVAVIGGMYPEHSDAASIRKRMEEWNAL